MKKIVTRKQFGEELGLKIRDIGTQGEYASRLLVARQTLNGIINGDRSERLLREEPAKTIIREELGINMDDYMVLKGEVEVAKAIEDDISNRLSVMEKIFKAWSEEIDESKPDISLFYGKQEAIKVYNWHSHMSYNMSEEDIEEDEMKVLQKMYDDIQNRVCFYISVFDQDAIITVFNPGRWRPMHAGIMASTEYIPVSTSYFGVQYDEGGEIFDNVRKTYLEEVGSVIHAAAEMGKDIIVPIEHLGNSTYLAIKYAPNPKDNELLYLKNFKLNKENGNIISRVKDNSDYSNSSYGVYILSDELADMLGINISKYVLTHRMPYDGFYERDEKDIDDSVIEGINKIREYQITSYKKCINACQNNDERNNLERLHNTTMNLLDHAQMMYSCGIKMINLSYKNPRFIKKYGEIMIKVERNIEQLESEIHKEHSYIHVLELLDNLEQNLLQIPEFRLLDIVFGDQKFGEDNDD